MDIDTSRYREGLPQIGYAPYRQVHAHSTGNKNSTAQNEADYHMRRPVESGFFSHVVGNGRVMQVGPVNNGCYDVGGGWNYETYAAVELIESHSTEEEFLEDYRLYIELLRNLADEAGLPKTLDSDALEGIKSHEYCTNNQPNNYSDHVDPYPYLASWGISRSQFKHDIENGLTVEKGWKENSKQNEASEKVIIQPVDEIEKPKTPFVQNPQIEKRPLGTNQNQAKSFEFKKPVSNYEQKSATITKELRRAKMSAPILSSDEYSAPIKHKKKSGWGVVLAIIAILMLGAGAGLVAYLVAFR